MEVKESPIHGPGYVLVNWQRKTSANGVEEETFVGNSGMYHIRNIALLDVPIEELLAGEYPPWEE